jgi:hypothetical protein
MGFLVATPILAAGCTAQQNSGKQGGSGDESLRPMIHPSEDLLKFPQDQVIKKELQVTTQWRSVDRHPYFNEKE